MSGRFLLVLLIGLAIVGFFGYRWFVRTPPQQVARKLRQSALWIAAGALILLAASGRAHWLWALLGGALPFAQRLLMAWRAFNLFKHLKGQMGGLGGGLGGSPATGSGGRNSTVNTRFLSMSLDHQSGALTGLVLEGAFKGRRLSELDLDQLLELLGECRSDEQSAAVLEAYLDREHPDSWRERFTARGGRTGSGSGALGAAMNREEAYQVLGLEPGADEAAIVAAHRRLMQKLHPDRGGSTFLAAKINQAKDLLLGK